MAKLHVMDKLFEAARLIWDDVDNEMLLSHSTSINSTTKRPTTKNKTPEEAPRSKPRKDYNGDPLLTAAEKYNDKVYQTHSRKICGDPLLEEVEKYHKVVDNKHACTPPEKDCGDGLFADAEQYHMVQDMEHAIFHYSL
jgi:hypothetical protein